MHSWIGGETKTKIMDFVRRVTDKDSSDYIPPENRIAVFDNDGTLWCEKPLPIQSDFLFRRWNQMSKENPDLKLKQPWKAISEKDY